MQTLEREAMSSHPERWKTGLVFGILAAAWIFFRLGQVDYDASRFGADDWFFLAISLFFLLLLVHVGFGTLDLIDTELSRASVHISWWPLGGKIVVVAMLVLAMWVSWLVRYDVQQRSATGPAVIVKLDRWTGTVYLSVGGDPWREITHKD
jgi:hypothetical protein